MPNNYATIDLGPAQDACFVVMPFHALFEAEYERVIRPAIEEAGLVCNRGKEIYTHQAIVQDIWKSLRSARLIVAELSGRNPNVMYEIGLAHAIGKPTILLTRNEDDVPFDLKALRYLFYNTNNPDWGPMLRADLTKTVRDVLQIPSLGTYLDGIRMSEQTSPVSLKPITTTITEEFDLSGVWRTSWSSVKSKRSHEAVLVISRDHGPDFTATMTVSYVREGKRTIVQETMSGVLRQQVGAVSRRGRTLTLSGVNYSFVEQGLANAYSLDVFELTVDAEASAMSGNARLKFGTRAVVFNKLSAPDSAQRF